MDNLTFWSTPSEDFDDLYQYEPEEAYQMDRRAQKSAKRSERKAKAAGQAGVKPPQPPLPTQNRFTPLKEQLKPQLTYADYVAQQPKPDSQKASTSATAVDPFSPVPGKPQVKLVLEKPSTSGN
jgi:hypothetical protein